jgi:hypothetical protein
MGKKRGRVATTGTLVAAVFFFFVSVGVGAGEWGAGAWELVA